MDHMFYRSWPHRWKARRLDQSIILREIISLEVTSTNQWEMSKWPSCDVVKYRRICREHTCLQRWPPPWDRPSTILAFFFVKIWAWRGLHSLRERWAIGSAAMRTRPRYRQWEVGEISTFWHLTCSTTPNQAFGRTWYSTPNLTLFVWNVTP